MIQVTGDDPDNVVVTTFSGYGFDPYEIMRLGLKQHPNTSLKDFVEETLRTFSYQKEIIVFRVTSPMKKMTLT